MHGLRKVRGSKVIHRHWMPGPGIHDLLNAGPDGLGVKVDHVTHELVRVLLLDSPLG
jgi:hypothetical protein